MKLKFPSTKSFSHFDSRFHFRRNISYKIENEILIFFISSLQDDSENEIRAGDDSDEPKSKKPKVASNNKGAKTEKNNKKK